MTPDSNTNAHEKANSNNKNNYVIIKNGIIKDFSIFLVTGLIIA